MITVVGFLALEFSSNDGPPPPTSSLDIFNATVLKAAVDKPVKISTETYERNQDFLNPAVPKINKFIPDEDVSSSSSSSKVSSSLTGERTNRIPNITTSAAVNTNSLNNSNINTSISNINNNNINIEKENISEILEKIKEFNFEQNVMNSELFGGNNISDETVVIVIQVHNRLQYLRQLITSMSTAKDIDKTLIVFSHDLYDNEINKLIRAIDYTRTLQIFYPYSIQTHPNEFPGESPNDCPRNAKKAEAQKLKCINSEWPDIYGHYREAKFTQTKHHWWWKAQRVFDQLPITKNHNGLVLFLEEDHMVSEDFIPTMKLLHSERSNICPDCDIICLGTYLKNYNYQNEGHKVEINQWVSAKHNMGMAFTRKLWNKIVDCKESFCNFDDYNWDWSLQHVFQSCFKEKKLSVMLLKGPRVFHIGECGVHHKKKECQTTAVVKKVHDILNEAANYLYPKKLILMNENKKRRRKLPKGNGGWGDKRDRELCIKIIGNRTTTDIITSAATTIKNKSSSEKEITTTKIASKSSPNKPST